MTYISNAYAVRIATMPCVLEKLEIPAACRSQRTNNNIFDIKWLRNGMYIILALAIISEISCLLIKNSYQRLSSQIAVGFTAGIVLSIDVCLLCSAVLSFQRRYNQTLANNV